MTKPRHCDDRGRDGRCSQDVFAVIACEDETVKPEAYCLDHLAQNVNGWVGEFGVVIIERVK